MTLNKASHVTRQGNKDIHGQTRADAAPKTEVANLCQGYDSVNGNGRVTMAIGGAPPVVGGATSEAYLDVCVDIEQVCQALGIGWSLGASIPGIGGASRKSAFVKTLTITTYSVTIVVYSKKVTQTSTVAGAQLMPGITPPQGDTALREFFYAYGDSFITSLTTGSEYYGVFVLHAQTETEQQGLVRELEAQGIYKGVKLSAELQTALNSSMNSLSVNISFDQQVSGIQNPTLPTPETMIQYAMDFPSIPADAPVILLFEYDGYEHVPEITTSFQPIADNRRYFIGDKAVAGLAAKEAQVQALDDQLSWLQETYAFYGGYTDAEVDRVKGMSSQELAAIASQKSAYDQDPLQSFTEPQLPSLALGTPALKFTWGVTNAVGSPGGRSSFDDVPDPFDYIAKRTCITAVRMKWEDRVDKLTTYYTDQNGETAKSHGGPGGDTDQSLALQSGQFVIRVTGKHGDKLDSLTFYITDGNTLTGGGSGGKYSFELVPPAGHFVLGFRGKSGDEFDSIAFVYAQFNPAVWST